MSTNAQTSQYTIILSATGTYYWHWHNDECAIYWYQGLLESFIAALLVIKL